MSEKLIYVCSPVRGEVEANIAKAREYTKTILRAGYTPIAPHVIFDGILNDTATADRAIALKHGLILVKKCDEVWVFGDVVSEGMKAEIELANREHIPIVFYNGEPKIYSVADWIEDQLSEREYAEFIKRLIADNDHDHPTYEKWRTEMEIDVTVEAAELKKKGVLRA